MMFLVTCLWTRMGERAFSPGSVQALAKEEVWHRSPGKSQKGTSPTAYG